MLWVDRLESLPDISGVFLNQMGIFWGGIYNNTPDLGAAFFGGVPVLNLVYVLRWYDVNGNMVNNSGVARDSIETSEISFLILVPGYGKTVIVIGV